METKSDATGIAPAARNEDGRRQSDANTPEMPLAVRSRRTRVVDLIRLGRPVFLGGGVLLYALGAAIAVAEGAQVNVALLLWGQLAVTSIQLMTHYSNEYFDFAADRANSTPTRWAGGSRVLPEGRLPASAALHAAIVLVVMTVLIAWTLVFILGAGLLALPLIGLALFLAWSYSAPPLTLHSRGLGELTTAVLVAIAVPLLAFYLQTGRLDALPLLASVPLFFLQFGMLLLVELPDEKGDAQVGKRTLVVRLGAYRASQVYVAALLTSYATLPFLVAAGLPSAVALAVGCVSPLAIWLGWQLVHGAWSIPARWESLCFWGIGLLMGTAGAELVAFLIIGR